MINEDFDICEYIEELFEKAGLEPSYYEDGSKKVSWDVESDEIDEGEYKVIVTVFYDTPTAMEGEGSIELFWEFSVQEIEDIEDEIEEAISFARKCINGRASIQFWDGFRINK